MKLIPTLLILACAGAMPAAAQNRRALAIEDYYRLKTVGAPRISPDGAWVLFTVGTRLEQDNGTRTETFVVPADASAPPRKLLHEGKEILLARWTHDSLVQYSAGGAAWKTAPGGMPVKVDRPTIAGLASPDGRWTALVKDQPAAKPAPAAAGEFERRHMERFRGVQFDWMLFQRDGEAFPAPDPTARAAGEIILTPTSLTPTSGGESRQLTRLGYRPSNLAWHPDGSVIAFTADPDWRDERKYSNPDLWTVSLDGTVTRLTDDGYVYANPDYSPDGRFLSYQRTFGTDMIIQQRLSHGGSNDLFIRPTAGGAPINLTAEWNYEPARTHWSPDSRYIYLTASIGGATHLFRIAPRAGAHMEQVTTGERRLNGIDFDKAFTRMTYTVGRRETPLEVWSASIDGTGERKLSAVHEEILSEIALSTADRLKWNSYDGTEIEGWLLYPYDYRREKGPYPLIVHSHGGPHSAAGYSFDFKQQYFAANGYFVLDTNFRSSTGYGDAFKWATWGAWGTRDGQDVISGVDHVLRNYPVDRNRVASIGHSYGGFMTNWLITQYPDRFAAAASGAGVSNWISDYGTADIFRTKETEFYGTPWQPEARDRMIAQSPLTFAGRVRTPTLFIHGQVDERVPYTEAEQMYFALKRRGVPSKMIVYSGMPHGIRGHWNNVHRMLAERQWFDTWLKR
ncbi:MAG: S9 family peptidase [Bryobacteraceae bacterium]